MTLINDSFNSELFAKNQLLAFSKMSQEAAVILILARNFYLRLLFGGRLRSRRLVQVFRKYRVFNNKSTLCKYRTKFLCRVCFRESPQ